MKSGSAWVSGLVLLDGSRRLGDLDKKDRSCLERSDDVNRFEHEFLQSHDHQDEAASENGKEKNGDIPPTPFDLMMNFPLSISSTTEATCIEALMTTLSACIAELYVSEPYMSRRQVSMQFTADVLQGTGLSIYEEEGRIIGDFICADAHSWNVVHDASEGMASELVKKLERDVRIYVRHDVDDVISAFYVDGKFFRTRDLP